LNTSIKPETTENIQVKLLLCTNSCYDILTMKNDSKIRKIAFELNPIRVFFVLVLFVLLFALPVSYHEGSYPFQEKTPQVETNENTNSTAATDNQGQVAGVSTTSAAPTSLSPARIATMIGVVFGIIALATLLYLGYTSFLKN
jgi:ABC-type dipeptide/oligopeptide/nickel transport system permease subunit